MSIKKLQQLGQTRPKPAGPPASKPIKDEIEDLDFDDDDEWAGMMDDDHEMFNAKGKTAHGRGFDYDDEDPSLPESDDIYPPKQNKPAQSKTPAQQPKMYAGNHPLNFGMQDDDDSDDFGTKVAKKRRLDDDTPPESDKPGDDDDLEDMDFDFNQATKAAKQEQDAAKKESDERKKKEIEEQVKKIREAAEEKLRLEELKAKEKATSRNDIDLSRNKGSTIDKVREDSGAPVSEDFNKFFGDLEAKQKKDEALDIDLSSAKESLHQDIDDKKSFEEFDIDKKFEDIEDDEP